MQNQSLDESEFNIGLQYDIDGKLSKSIDGLLSTGDKFESNLRQWLWQLKLIQSKEEWLEALEKKKYAVMIDGQRVSEFGRENRALFRDNIQVKIVLS